jgi:hypothetical protein
VASGRRFGVTVGLAFIALALLVWWRGHPVATGVLGAAGGALVVGGLVVPGAMQRVERWWMAGARALSRVTTPLLLGIVYMVVVMPIGFAARLLKATSLRRAETAGGFWVRRERNDPKRGGLRHQF